MDELFDNYTTVLKVITPQFLLGDALKGVRADYVVKCQCSARHT